MSLLRSLTRIPLLVFALFSASLQAQELSYSRDIRPILSQYCFRCHGPDASHRKAKLRLDRPSAAVREHLVARITSSDPEEVMPPRKSGKRLTAAQIDRLTRWVEQGAEYEQHWAFVLPARPDLPDGLPVGLPVGLPAEATMAESAIDRLVHARLKEHGQQPSEPADRLTLARRVYLDLIGLPPTPEVADAFVQDRSPDAYEKLVDRLLASPRYGERWARPWLDLARYADTNGYEKDRERSIWPYRDWVIKAINADMPYDQFVIEQIAGDMLPNATSEQRIATGFHRNTMLNEEGGIDPLEYRFYAMNDRVSTTGTAILGLTLGCAQCHTHKFDPITHSDYYGMFAFLNNCDEPSYTLPDAAKDDLWKTLRQRADAEQRGLAARWPSDAKAGLEDRFEAWLAGVRAGAVRWTALTAIEAVSNLPLLTRMSGGVVFCSGDTTKHDIYRLGFEAGSQPVTALRLEALPDGRLPSGGPGMTYYEGTIGDFFLAEFKLTADGKAVGIARATDSYRQNRYGNHPVSAALAIDSDLQTGWSVHGRIGERHSAVFVLAEPIAAGTRFELEMHFGRHYASSLGKFRVSGTADPRGGRAMAFEEDIETLLERQGSVLSTAERDRLRDTFLLTAPEVAAHAKRIGNLRKAPAYITTLVLQERPEDNPRPTHRHHRGEFLQAAELVSPRVPDALHAWPEGADRDRLGLARWLVSKENPLAARVAVNRHWAAFFGKGLVETLDDFGSQGELPSHPMLLDWLACEFMASGWSQKALHRSIVTSLTYQQSSYISPEALMKDPQNRWLGRASRFRLDAEVLRDAALSSAGALSNKMFGPPVRPPQPEGINEFAYGNVKWNTSKGEDRRRRSIYTFIKRTAPYALFQTFDAPSGESCTARRDVSNTPLQALSLLNDPQFLEIAQEMGSSLASARLDRRKELRQSLRQAFRRVLTRQPSTTELDTLADFFYRQQKRFAADPARARSVAGISPTDELAESLCVRRATWTALCRALFSLDEALTHN